MKKIIACVFAFCLAGISAYASEVQCGDFDANGKAEISGRLDSAATAQIVVFAPVTDPLDPQNTIPIDLDSAADDEIGQSVVYVNDVAVSGSQNLFSLPIKMKSGDKSGIYTIRVTSGGIVVAESTFRYDSPAKKIETVRAVNAAASAGDMLSVIGNHEDELCANFELYSKLGTGKAQAAKYLFKYKEKLKAVNSVGFDETDPTNAFEVFRYSTAVATFADSGVSDKTAALEHLLCIRDNASIAKWYDKTGVPDNVKALWHSGIAARLSGQGFDDFADFESKFTAALIFEVIMNNDGVDNVVGIIKDFAAEIGISDAETVTTSRCDSVKGKNYSGFGYVSLLADLFPAAPSPNPGGGGGGGGGSTYVPSVSVTGGTKLEPIDSDPANDLIFKDMSGSIWANEAVEGLFKKGIISGKADGEFAPEDNLLREEFVKIIVGAAQLRGDSAELHFDDVAESDWFFEYVVSARENGIISGVSENEFGVGQSITRQDTAVIIYNTLKAKGADLPEAGFADSFSDSWEVADYAKEALAVLTSMKIFNGYEDSTLRPTAHITRAEAAKVIYGILDLLG